MPLVTRAQVNMKKEVAWGTAITTDRSMEVLSENFKERVRRIEAPTLRLATPVLRKDRTATLLQDAAGPLVFPVLSKQFAFWGEHMMGGTVVTTGPTDSATTHTFNMPTSGTILLGKGVTMQVNRPFTGVETDQAFTFSGGKVASWELAADVGGLLQCTLHMDFKTVTTATGLAAAAYPSGTVDPFPYFNGTITVGGTTVPVNGITIAVDNKLLTDRFLQDGTLFKKEPLEMDFKGIAVTLKNAEFTDLNQYNRFVAATAAGATATITATWTAPTLIGVSTFPQITVTVHDVRIDDVDGEQLGGGAPLVQTIAGTGVYDGSTTPLSIAIVTAEATP